MSYVDGVLIAVPTARKEAFIAYARALNALFLACGATACVDCWGEEVPAGEVTDFPRAVQAREDETVVFSWITWPDKAARTAGWEKAMADPRWKTFETMPFDARRMIYGGFDMVAGE